MESIELVKIIIPSIISCIGFAITIILNRLSLRKELNKRFLSEYSDNFANIEYDIAEILQLSIRDYLGEDEYAKLEYNIQKHRHGEFGETDSISERLYRIGGYISTFSSHKPVNCLNKLRKMHHNFTGESAQTDPDSLFCEFVSYISILKTSIESDILKKRDHRDVDDELAWLQTRLPVSIYDNYEAQLRVKLKKVYKENI